MKNKTNIEFITVLIVSLILIYSFISFIEMSFYASDWNVTSRIIAVIAFILVNGYSAKILYK